MKIHLGRAWPLGSSITSRGVNFSIAAPNANRVELLLYKQVNDIAPERIIELNSNHRSGDYWHIEIENLKEGSIYCYRVFEQKNVNGNPTSNFKVLIDPCARAIGGWDVYQRNAAKGTAENLNCCLKGIVSERDQFDFDSHPRPRHSWKKCVIYELHVGGFTNRPDSKVLDIYRGTFNGLSEKIPYLKDLGITTIELLPIYAFDPYDAPKGLDNYWGYSPINWFTPHHEYISGNNHLEARNQVRELVGKCHDEGIEVIIDVVYNHTAEGNHEGPTISWKGFADSIYYYKDKDNKYQDVSGCGNSIAANRPLVRQLILESMRCWANELGVDGFRFDLGIALSRGENLMPLEKPPLFEEIEADPLLSGLKIVSEPWDCGGLYKLGDFPSKTINTWNGHYRDDIRKFWKGDKGTTWLLKERLTGSPDLYKDMSSGLWKSINFITAHDGFTLHDLVSFDVKHNLANGEDNRDGENHNNSWNHGVEGPSTNDDLLVLRNRQKKNLLATLLLSPGTPMLLMGDEVSRSQGGNNNTWCQNSPLGWMIWDEKICDRNMYSFIKKLLQIRATLPELFCPDYPHKEEQLIDPNEKQKPLWIQWHGIKPFKPDWNNWSHTISYSINKGNEGSVLWMGFNAYSKKMFFELPKNALPLTVILNTSLTSPEDLKQIHQKTNLKEIELESRSVILMISREYSKRLKI